MKLKLILLLIVLATSLIGFTGCQAIGALGSPSASELKNTAEYDLTKNQPGKILVLVEQPASVRSDVNIRLYLSQFIEGGLVEKLELKPETIVPYTQLVKLRSERADFQAMTPVEVGRALGATHVLHIIIDNFGLYGLGGTGYYKANLDVRSGLYDVKTDTLLWPQGKELKSVKVAIDSQRGSYDNGAIKLSQAAAKCILRNLYDSPSVESRVPEEVKDPGVGW